MSALPSYALAPPAGVAGPDRLAAVILSAVARFHYLTAAQVSRLVFPGSRDECRYARRRLALLADDGLLLRLRPVSVPRRGAAAHVFTATGAGRRQRIGAHDAYFRPREEQQKAGNLPFLEHTLASQPAEHRGDEDRTVRRVSGASVSHHQRVPVGSLGQA